MTVAALDTKETFLGDGTSTAFDFNFALQETTDLRVLLSSESGVETTLTLDTDYSVVLNANQNTNPGGTVTFVTAPGENVPITIMRNLDFARGTEFTSSVPPHVIEAELDRLTMYAQQIKEKLDRSLHVSPATQQVDDVNYRNVAARASKIVGFDDNGQAALYGFEDGSIVGPAGAVLAARVEYSAPAIFTQAPNQSWSHTEVTLTFIWTSNGVEVESRELVVTINDETGEFVDPGLSEPGDEFTTTLSGTKLLSIGSEYSEVRAYAQLSIVQLPSDAYDTDDFTPTWGVGFVSDPVGDVTYALRAGVVTLLVAAALTGESDTSAMTWAAATLPAAIRPSTDRAIPCVLQYDDTTEVLGQALIGTDGSVVFTVHVVAATVVSVGGVFQTGEDKGLPAHWNVVYPL